MRTKPLNELNLDFPARSINEGLARTAVACFAAALDPTLDELNDIKTAVSEAVTNAIVHAYPEEIGRVWVKARLYPEGKIEISVRDRGVGIANVDEARKPMFTTGNEERSGMGFTIMESFMDSLKVRSRMGGGTVVRMTKTLSPRPQRG